MQFMFLGVFIGVDLFLSKSRSDEHLRDWHGLARTRSSLGCTAWRPHKNLQEDNESEARKRRRWKRCPAEHFGKQSQNCDWKMGKQCILRICKKLFAFSFAFSFISNCFKFFVNFKLFSLFCLLLVVGDKYRELMLIAVV